MGSRAGAVTALGQATNGQLVIGSTGADPVLSTLTAGTGVTITNTAGSVSIAATGTGGTVTSVATAGTVNGITLTGGTITSTGTITLGGTLSGVDLTSQITGVLPVANGGTNLSSYSVGDILYASGATTLTKLAAGSNADVLTLAAGVPSWATPTTGDIESVQNATNGGIESTNGTGPDVTLAMDINNLSTATIDIAADYIAFSDESAAGDPTKKILASGLTTALSGSILTNLSGDVSVTAAGVVSVNSVQADAVALGTDTTGNYVATLGAGTGVTIGSNTGEGSTPTITVDYGTSANTAAQGNTAVTFLGTANEVELSTNTFTTVGGGGAVTIGLPNDVTIGNNLTVSNNAIISGDLTVSGTASFTHSENLDIADRFITLASGSTTATDGGIVVAQGAAGSTQYGEAFGFNASAGGDGRWGITGSLDNDSGAIVPLDYILTARSSTSAPSAAPVYGGTSGFGNMHVDTNNEDIYIYV